MLMETDLKGMRRLLPQYGDQMMPHLVEALQMPLTDETITDAIMARKAVTNKAWRFFRKYDLVRHRRRPSRPSLSASRGRRRSTASAADPFQWLPFTFPFNMTGQPAASVPAGFTTDGLPVGLQIIGRHLDDQLVLRASAAYEAAAPWKDRWPPMLAAMGL